jgi:hypothetical protein
MMHHSLELSEIQMALVKTTIFFDLFLHPLTAYELWRYLDTEANFEEVEIEAHALLEKNVLEMKNGFYFLPGKESLVTTRQ